MPDPVIGHRLFADGLTPPASTPPANSTSSAPAGVVRGFEGVPARAGRGAGPFHVRAATPARPAPWGCR